MDVSNGTEEGEPARTSLPENNNTVHGDTNTVEDVASGSRLIKTTKFSTSRGNKYYNMNHEKRGLALIFNHFRWKKKTVIGGKRSPYPERKGSMKDADDLKILLEWLGFEVRVYQNLSQLTIDTILEDVKKEDHDKHDCLLVTVMTHGNYGQLVDGDGNCYHLDILWERFESTNCRSLAGKPKIFFIQACRGRRCMTKFTDLEYLDERMDSGDFSYTIPRTADFLIAFSTAENSASWRCTQIGSWFIQSICNILPQRILQGNDFLSGLAAVARYVAVTYAACQCKNRCSDIEQCTNKSTQAPQTMSTLMRKIVFRPKMKEKWDEINIAESFQSLDVNDAEEDKITQSEVINYLQVSKHKEYYHSGPKRGVAVIINCHKWKSEKLNDLNGYLQDRDKLVACLQKLQFDVRVVNNPSLQDINQRLDEVAREDHYSNDCLVVIVLTHGSKDAELVDGDGKTFRADILWTRFNHNLCPQLTGKPKIFIVQACRGDKEDEGTDLQISEPDSGNYSYLLPDNSDFLIFYSTVKGYISWVNSAGSIFLQAVCHALTKVANHPELDLISALTEVNKKVALATSCRCVEKKEKMQLCEGPELENCPTKRKQMPQILTTLIRKVMFPSKANIQQVDRNPPC